VDFSTILRRPTESMGTSSALGSVVRAWDVRDVSDQAPLKRACGVFVWGLRLDPLGGSDVIMKAIYKP